ncbi:MAG: DUF58 domain-containing protein [Rheinheimera sp.]|nr:DUF58 domain-containing protein [Rheinheimera sp.]
MSDLTLQQRWHQYYWRILSRYLDKRQPPADSVTLVQKLIFILPSRYGWWFLLLIVLLYLLGTNYQNNLILLLCYLLLSLFLFSIALCYANMSGLTLHCRTAPEGYAGSTLHAEILLSSAKHHQMLELCFIAQPPSTMLTTLQTNVSVPLHTKVRGRFMLPRLKISSQYPFGLWRAWSYVALQQHYWVYPAPENVPGEALSSEQDNSHTASPSMDTLAPYRSGDSLRHIIWKRLARDPMNPVVRQHFIAPEAQPDWVVVPALSAEALERALRKACYRLLELEQQGGVYGLKLPGQTVTQAQGAAHLQRCLQALALC